MYASTRISESAFADIMGVSKRTLNTWKANGKYKYYQDIDGIGYFLMHELIDVPEIKEMAEK